MTTTAASHFELQLAAFSAELHDFLDSLPARLKSGRLAQVRAECAALLERAPEAAGERWASVRTSLADLRHALDTSVARAYLQSKYEATARAYEHWLASRRGAAMLAESLKPLRGARTWFHIAMGVLATVLYQFVITRSQAMALLGTLLAIFAALEVTRRLFARWNDVLVDNVFKLIARPREYHRVNSATWYLVALCLLTPVFSRPAVLSGVLILAFGDPAAAWVGKRWGRLKLYRSKSLLGSLSFVAAGTLVTSAFLIAFHPALPLANRLIAASLASILGAVAELFSERLDDNLTVPIAAVLSAALFL